MTIRTFTAAVALTASLAAAGGTAQAADPVKLIDVIELSGPGAPAGRLRVAPGLQARGLELADDVVDGLRLRGRRRGPAGELVRREDADVLGEARGREGRSRRGRRLGERRNAQGRGDRRAQKEALHREARKNRTDAGP